MSDHVDNNIIGTLYSYVSKVQSFHYVLVYI